MKRVTCSGCSLLCDDIIIRSDGIFIDEIIGACLKGKEKFDKINAKNRILNPFIRKNDKLEKVSWDEALSKVVEIIKKSSKPLLYGFSNASCEAQLKGIELAKLIDGFIDSNATICQGKVLDVSKETSITLTSLSEIINKADLLVLWGANVAESIPRLLNKVLFSRGKFRMTGREIKTLIIIDPVKTTSFNAMGVRDIALRIEPDKDIDLIRVLKEECCKDNSIPSKGVAGLDREDLKRLLLNMMGSENCVIFMGQGILNSHSKFQVIKELLELIEMINEKQQKGRISIVVLGCHFNTAGFAHVALSSCGISHSLQFFEGKIIFSSDTIVSKIEKEDFDCSIIVGNDPISQLPYLLSSKLSLKPMIVLDNFNSATTFLADVVLPIALTGIEADGLAYRLDQIPIELNKLINPPNNIPSDQELLNQIIEKVKST